MLNCVKCPPQFTKAQVPKVETMDIRHFCWEKCNWSNDKSILSCWLHFCPSNNQLVVSALSHLPLVLADHAESFSFFFFVQAGFYLCLWYFCLHPLKKRWTFVLNFCILFVILWVPQTKLRSLPLCWKKGRNLRDGYLEPGPMKLKLSAWLDTARFLFFSLSGFSKD